MTDQARSPWPTRRTFRWLAGALAAFGAYLSFIPFDYQSVPLHDAVARFGEALTHLPHRASRTDFGANVFFFVFVGFSFCGALSFDRGGWPKAGAALLSAFAVVCLSVVLEFGQLFFPPRVVSGLDVLAAAIGGVVGTLAWLAVGQAAAGWMRTSADTRARPGGVARLLAAYAIGYVVAGLIPFDITLDVGQLASKYHAGRILFVPFGGPHSGGPATWDALWTAMSALPIGVLASLTSDRRGRGLTPFAAMGAGTALVAAIEVAQLFVFSRYADVTDVLSGAAGVGAGVLMASRWIPRQSDHLGEPREPREPRSLLVWALVLWTLAVVAYHWYPFDFVLQAGPLKTRLRTISLVPFSGYYRSDPFNAATQFLSKFALAVPLGLLAGRLGARRGDRLLRNAAFAVAALGFFGMVEAGQLLLPTRTPDAGDAMLGAFGAALGMWMSSS